MSTKSELIKKAINAAGGVEAVSKHFDLGERAVRKWWQVEKVPDSHTAELCKLGNFEVAPHQLNPQSFPEYLTA
ncbi:YdaS family helix-turn-helix protein [Neptuniibacter sp.]|uniref:YdaS family helix-turn-helix protein n=1 Tax=Neptuniibacter sp. TaxID=1962643 RepID=UPI002612F41C|nr:YdaS family helix-turn-helix protein [Neptuniibacter sp.]MCP4596164.1 helix-turn-helix domain-containing protein [Neptuniibacter sp.]